jgi:hypothetical protein
MKMREAEMETIKSLATGFCVALAVAGLTAASASAGLIDKGATTVDTDLGLEFLDLTASQGRSYNDVAGQFGVGGDFEGWRHATTAEVSALFTHGGFPGNGVVVSPADASIIPFIELIGATLNIVDADGGQRVSTDGLFDDSDTGSFPGSAGLGELVYDTRTGQPFFNVSQSLLSIDGVGVNLVQPILGHFLVRAAVPEPGALALLGLGVLTLGTLRRRSRRG